MPYLKFIKNNKRFLCFGFFLMLLSSFGQTFFISLFSGELREEFNLSHGSFGLIYSIGTLASGMTLIWAGQKIDNIELRKFTIIVFVGLIIAAVGIATSPSVFVLYPAIYLLRLFGQGLMSHTAMTSMARYFHKNRGKALSLATLGLPAGEAFFPIIVVSSISLIGWQFTWLCAALILASAISPTIVGLLKNHNERHKTWLKREKQNILTGDTQTQKQFTRKEVLLDTKFYLIAPSILAPSFIVTGLFFHQVHIASSKAWSLSWLASTFALYAIATVFASLLSGTLIDRHGANRLLPYYLPPLGASLLLLSTINHPIIAVPYMILAGITVGFGNPLINAIWAELYGTVHIGAIRSLSIAMMVTASALSPVTFGWLIDNNISIENISLGCLGYILGASLILIVGIRKNFL